MIQKFFSTQFGTKLTSMIKSEITPNQLKQSWTVAAENARSNCKSIKINNLVLSNMKYAILNIQVVKQKIILINLTCSRSAICVKDTRVDVILVPMFAPIIIGMAVFTSTTKKKSKFYLSRQILGYNNSSKMLIINLQI